MISIRVLLCALSVLVHWTYKSTSHLNDTAIILTFLASSAKTGWSSGGNHSSATACAPSWFTDIFCYTKCPLENVTLVSQLFLKHVLSRRSPSWNPFETDLLFSFLTISYPILLPFQSFAIPPNYFGLSCRLHGKVVADQLDSEACHPGGKLVQKKK